MEHTSLIKTIKEIGLKKLNENYKVTKKKKVAKKETSEVEINPVIDSFSANR